MPLRNTSVGTLALLLVGACQRSDVPTRPTTAPLSGSVQTSCGSVKPGGSSEGEIFGSIWVNGARSCTTTYGITLNPYADAQSRLHMASYSSSLVGDPGFANMFEWWEPTAGYPCGSAGQTPDNFHLNGSPWAEVIHAPANPKEAHCVRPGRYAFSGAGREFDVDYIQWSGQTVTNTGTGATEYVEASTYLSSAMSNWQDLVINIDLTSVHPGDNPVLEVQKSTSADGYLPTTFTNETNPSGTAADWFRFSVMRSTSNWTIDTRGAALARLYFDGTDPAQATGYYTYVPEGAPVLRLHQFPNPSTASKQYVVGLELMRPDELPSTPTVTRTVTITRINPDLAPGTITAPAGGARGSAMGITIQERNLGTSPFAPVEAGWTAKVYLSTDAVLSPGTDSLIDTYVESNPIAAGQTQSVPRSPMIPVGLAEGTYYVIVSLDANGTVIESNESNNVGVSGAVNISAPVYANASFEGTTTWRNTDQLFSSAGSSQGPNIQYRWQTDAGGPWSAYQTSTQYEFMGHGSAGTHYVTLEVKNTLSGVTATQTVPFTVQSGLITMTGPTYITVKGNYSYSASTASRWWERILPTQTWSGGIGPQTNWTRTWSAGCYEVDVRADASGGGVLKRGRLHIIVAIGTGCQPRP